MDCIRAKLLSELLSVGIGENGDRSDEAKYDGEACSDKARVSRLRVDGRKQGLQTWRTDVAQSDALMPRWQRSALGCARLSR